MASLLYEDCRRLKLLPTEPILIACSDVADPELAVVHARFPGLFSSLPLEAGEGTGSEWLWLCGRTEFSGEELGRLFGLYRQAELCTFSFKTATRSPGFACRLKTLVRVAGGHGYHLADLRVRKDLEATDAEQVRDRICRVSFARKAGGALSSEQQVRRALILEAGGLGEAAAALAAPLERAQASMDFAYLRSAKAGGLGPVHPVSDFAQGNSDLLPRPGWDRSQFPILISIHMQSNNPKNFATFCDRIANSCDDPSRVEVIVKIDDDHAELNELLPQEISRQPFQLKYISTPLVGGFFALWESMNDMLAITDPGAYFLLNLNDEMYFSDRGWDTRVARYVGLYPDHLYRLRTSVYRTRNYHDHWECGFAPETSAITTKRWIETGGNWNPCLGPDTFQQCVAYYFNLIDRKRQRPRFREIPIDDIRFGGEGAYVGLTGAALRRRVRGATRAWFRLMSGEIQEEAAKRAAKLHGAITAHEHGLGPGALKIDARTRTVAVVEPGTTHRLAQFSYAIPRARYRWLNARRALQFAAFGGGGTQAFRGSTAAALSFLALRYDWVEKIRAWVYEDPPAAMTATFGRVRLARYSLTRFTRNYVPHAPGYAHLYYIRGRNRMRGYASLFYHRILKRIGNTICLVGRRSRGYAKNAIWRALFWLPGEARDRAKLLYYRQVRHGIGVLDLVTRRAVGHGRITLWQLSIGIPLRIRGQLSLFYHRRFKHGVGLLELGARRGVGYGRVAAWQLLVGVPHRIRGKLSFFYHRRIKYAAGLLELGIRLCFGRLRVLAWQILVGIPRRVCARFLPHWKSSAKSSAPPSGSG